MAPQIVVAAATASSASDIQVFFFILTLVQLAPLSLALLYAYPALVEDHVTLFATALVVVGSTIFVFYRAFKWMKLDSVVGVIFTIVVFTAYIDFYIALCLAIPGFELGKFYLDQGEKYFLSAYGFACLMWDGSFHVVIQFVVAFLAFTKRDYSFPALVWAGSVLNSMAPLLLGAATGAYATEIQLATALNLPYIFLPIGIIIFILAESPARKRKDATNRVQSTSALADLVLLILNFLVPIIHIVRVITVLNQQSPVSKWWIRIEPVLNEANIRDMNERQDYAFIKVQVLEWAFWYVLWHWALLFEQVHRIVIKKRSGLIGSFGVDLSAIALGGYLQSMFCYVITSVFDMKDGEMGLYFRKEEIPSEFWYVNVATILGCILHLAHFHLQDIEELKQD